MSEVYRMVGTALLTVFSGSAVFVVGQLLSRVVLEPAIEFRRLIGKVDFLLTYHAHYYMNPGVAEPQALSQASSEVREAAAQLRAQYHALSWRWLAERLGVLPVGLSEKGVLQASQALIGISNSFHQGNIDHCQERRAEVAQALGLKGHGFIDLLPGPDSADLVFDKAKVRQDNSSYTTPTL